MPESPVRELRLALTVERYDEAVAFYRDALGLPVNESFEGPGAAGSSWTPAGPPWSSSRSGRPSWSTRSRSAPVSPGRSGSRWRWPTRPHWPGGWWAAAPRRWPNRRSPPWRHRNVRLRAPDGTQLTLFTVLDDAGR
jgi:hypothetical protein